MPRYAAIDIGSNSARMLAADVLPGGRQERLAEDRVVTRLGASVFRGGFIDASSIDMLCTVLRRMADAYRALDVVGCRAVATAAVRDASNQAEFLERASEALGSEVEIISGQEEARLIHLGVQACWPHPDQQVVVIDIGGGSAELIVSEDGRLDKAFSKPLGAVRLTEVFLSSDPPKRHELESMREFIGERLEPAVEALSGRPIDRAIATSSTAAAVVCAVNQIPRSQREHADRISASATQVRKLCKELSTMDTARRARVVGIGPRRAQIVVAGAITLYEIMDRLRLPAIHYSVAGVRDGIIADLAERGVGRDSTQLSREQRKVVESLARRYGIALKHARHVAGFARQLFEALRGIHRLAPYWGRIVDAAAHLMDAGHFISDTGHHKHSEYIVTNSDLPGFNVREKRLIAALCRFHRKSLPGSRHTSFQQFPAEDRRALLYLIPIVRLADALDQTHQQRVQSIRCAVEGDTIRLFLLGDGTLELEQWAAERLGGVFGDIYERRIEVAKDQP